MSNYDKDEQHNADTLKSVLERISYLEKCEELLDKIYSEVGPYGVPVGQKNSVREGTISWETWDAVRNHFHFDDGE